MGNISSIEDVKSTNRQAVLNKLRRMDLLSRTQLAEETGLSKATITRILSELLTEGLVEEVRTIESGVGRPHVLLRLVTRTRCAVGVELTSSVARITLTDMNARPLKQRIVPINDHDVKIILDGLAREVTELCQDVPAEQMVGLGVAVPGIVNPLTGIVNLDFPAGWRDVSLVSRLKERLGYPVVVANQVHAAAWGEKWYGGNQVSDLLYIRLGSKAEAGVILDGNLHFGKMFTAGAIGHMTIDPAGDLCACGNHGCLNTVVGSPAVLATARMRLKDNSASMLLGMVEGNTSLLTMEHLMGAVQAGDGLAMQIFQDVGRAVGIIIAGLMNLLSFEKVIIGGQLSMAESALLTPLQEEVYRRALPSSLVLGRIEITKLGADAASIGAASLLLQKQTYRHTQA